MKKIIIFLTVQLWAFAAIGEPLEIFSIVKSDKPIQGKPAPVQERIENFERVFEGRDILFLQLEKGFAELVNAEEILIPLQNDVRGQLVLNGVEKLEEPNSLKLEGRILFDKRSRASLTLTEHGLSGFIVAGGHDYGLYALGDSLHAIVSRFDPEEAAGNHARLLRDFDLTRDEVRDRLGLEKKQTQKEAAQFKEMAEDTANNFVDIMVVYTDDVAAAIADPASTVQGDIDYLNQALEDGCANYRFRLVHTEELSYVETANRSTDLNCIRDGSDGCLDQVHTLRDTYGADLVQLWTSTSNVCGIAYVNQEPFNSAYGFGIKQAWCGSSTTAHEVGHNLGLAHDRFQTGVDLRQASNYGFGHGYVDVVNKARSIMSYADQCTQLGYQCPRSGLFSNPKVYYEGQPHGVDGFVDAVGRVNTTLGYVKDFRTETSPYSVDINPNCISETEAEKDVHCFIATAAYGSYLHDHVITLRKFRDEVLSRSKLGKRVIALYYNYSPKWAAEISQRPWAKSAVRWFITPVVIILKAPWLIFVVFGLSLIGILALKVSVRRSLLMTALLFLTWGNDGNASMVIDSIFENDIGVNPAATWRPNARSYIGYSQFMASSEAKESSDSNTETSGSIGELHAGFRSLEKSVELKYMPASKIETKSEISPFPETTDEETLDSQQLNFGMNLFPSTVLGLKYLKSNSETQLEGQENEETIENTNIGLGMSYKFSETLFLGGGVDYVTEKGSDIAESRWIGAYLGAAAKATTMPLQGEISFTRTPEVKDQEDTLFNFHGETQRIKLRVESEMALLGPLISSLRFGVGYESKVEKSVTGFIPDDLKSTILQVDLALMFLNSNLFTGLSYQSLDESFGEKKSETTVGAKLAYLF